MSDKVEKEIGDRRSDRLHHELMVAYRTENGSGTDWAVDISKGGLFINTRSPQAIGTVVKLIISMPDAKQPFDLTGRVTRIVGAGHAEGQVTGMAIEFLDIDDEKKERIERFVERLQKELKG